MNSLLILIFFACLAASFLMSGMEAGVFALSRLRIRRLARTGNPRAAALYGYLENPEEFLWTILVGNTVTNFIAVGIGVMQLHHWLRESIVFFWIALGVAVILFYAICELMPKMLFRFYPNRLCMTLVPPFRFIHLILRPLVGLMTLSSRSLLRWFGGKRFTGHLFGNREELRRVMQESAQGLAAEKRAMINCVLDLQHLTVAQIAIPMKKAVTVSDQMPLKELFGICRDRGFSRLPVWKDEGTSKRIAGLVSLRPLLYETNLDETKRAGEFIKPAFYLDQDTRLEVALRQMQRTGQRLAIVLGRDQREVGVVSLEDILKVIFGEVKL